jgi:hypothetical protein
MGVLSTLFNQLNPGPDGHWFSFSGQTGVAVTLVSAFALIATGGTSALFDGTLAVGANALDIWGNAIGAVTGASSAAPGIL